MDYIFIFYTYLSFLFWKCHCLFSKIIMFTRFQFDAVVISPFDLEIPVLVTNGHPVTSHRESIKQAAS